MKNRTVHSARLTALLCIVLFFYGFYLGGIQLVLSEVSTHYGLQKTGMGALVSAQHATAVIFPVILGILADRKGKKLVMILACGFFCVGCILAGSSQALAVYVLGALCVGVGYSVCESVGSAALADLDPQKSARTINLSQALLSLGAVISPQILQFLREHYGYGWRLPFAICAAAYGILALVLLTACFPQKIAAEKKEESKVHFFSSKIFCCLFFGIICYIGLENGISYFIESLFSGPLQRADLGANAISAYWLGMVLSRLLSSAVLKHPERVVTACFALSGLMLLGIALCPYAVVSLVLCALAGFFYGPIWCTLVALAANRFPHASARAAGLMSAGTGLGGIAAPLLMGAVCDRFSIPTAFVMLGAIALLGMLLMLLMQRLERNPTHT